MAKNAMNKIVLKVREAAHKDVGRGIVRLDPKDMEKIQAEIGDILEIKGKRKTVAKLHPTLVEDRGKEIIQIDGIIRENAGVSLDEKVEVKKVSCQVAGSVTLTPIGSTDILREMEAKHIGRLLEGIALIKGDQVRATLLGTKSQDFTVVDTDPEGTVMIQPNTRIRIKGGGKAVKSAGASYEDIGGLDKEIRRVREMIELPLKYPEVFEKLGIEAPRGVLLHGPPGCGKTLIARAVARESGVYFTQISGPQIMHKFYGESEAHLRAIFDDAQANAPSIAFIDEIDAIAPKREALGEEKQVERRVVAQLLALMDGLKDRGKIVVIAATNIPDVLDPALRRPGRFDREICIPIPNQEGRLEIFEIHTRGMPLTHDVSLDKLSEITHGFTGADIESLCREAAMTTIREIIPDINFDLGTIPYEKLANLEVGRKHFMEALNVVEPSALREVAIETPDVGWEDVGGLDDVKKILRETIEWPLKYPFVFEHTRSKPPKGILLHGEPGTGKTLIAKAVAKESGVNFISIKGPSLINKWLGESERGVREIFKKGRQHAPCIIFFDEIDSIAPVRSGGGSNEVIQRVVSQLLTELDGIEELRGVIVIGATNRLDIVDPALLRPGRFDFLLELPLPDKETRIKIFEIHTRGKPLAEDVDLQKLAEQMEGKTGADIASVSQKAVMLAIRAYIDKNSEPEKAKKNLQELKIGMKYFEEAMAEIPESDEEAV